MGQQNGVGDVVWLWTKPWRTQTCCMAELKLQLSDTRGPQLFSAPGALDSPIRSQRSQAREDWANVAVFLDAKFFFTSHFLPLD